MTISLVENFDLIKVEDRNGISLKQELVGKKIIPKQFNFSKTEKDALIAFLKTLTDETLVNDPKFSDPFVKK